MPTNYRTRGSSSLKVRPTASHSTLPLSSPSVIPVKMKVWPKKL